MNETEYLVHHGVKGMKWGIRKKRVSTTSRKKGIFSFKKKKATVSSKKSSTKKIRVEDMTDSQLDRGIERKRKEKLYKELTQPQISNGKKIAKDILSNAARRAVTDITYQLMMHIGGSAINKAAGKKIIKVKNDDDEKKKKKAD